ncbi:unnamed protein product [Phytophthora lilii]|uniref:Unnamed protein product n=1 Tax=Phytophthora lilii TaxID=2077276 RepID=A0A9W6UDH3_9STRA|nr:unnamed protein product [Phytophthora lilii]
MQRLPLQKLKDVCFPNKIRALPHILKSVNELAKSEEEVFIEAAEAGDMERLKKIKKRFGYSGLGKAMITASSGGLLDVVRIFLGNDGEYLSDEETEGGGESKEDNYLSWEAKRDAAVAAAASGSIDIVRLLFPEIIFYEYDSDDEENDMLYQSNIPRSIGCLKGNGPMRSF